MKPNKLNVGDTIKCSDKAEAIMIMMALEDDGLETDFLYEKDGQKGLWIEVTGIQKGDNDAED